MDVLVFPYGASRLYLTFILQMSRNDGTTGINEADFREKNILPFFARLFFSYSFFLISSGFLLPPSRLPAPALIQKAFSAEDPITGSFNVHSSVGERR